ncbi:N-acetylglucosamine kinase [Chitinophaga alhagiae]|uniref:N-acetylglucosamine kinase n=1 Tax=Chitinophaga alhagiae TaxID=2203219 RepID=UPI000E5B4DA2|nr:N-acetylglucosamine kinase [Chitinophaga alhagiae]
MLLIADSGSTKTAWCLVNEAGEENYFNTEGYNPFFVSTDYAAGSIRASFPAEVDINAVSRVYFYGAGCQDGKELDMEAALRQVFTHAAHVSAEVDLLAAARGLLGNSPGFAAILGTGTNTCLYNGRQISMNIDSLGFMLGDEGSGAAIGKKILSDFLRHKMPGHVRQLFESTYGLSEATIMHQVYKEPLPNRYCAGFTRFLSLPDIDEAYAQAVLRGAFSEFFTNLVSCYPGYREYAFNCVGSVGYHFRETLNSVAAAFGMQTGLIIPDLIGHLVKHHRQPVAG